LVVGRWVVAGEEGGEGKFQKGRLLDYEGREGEREGEGGRERGKGREGGKEGKMISESCS
jgi:hypothetical protein